MPKLTAQGRFWIGSESGIVLGPGRAELLERIAAEGSISKAAASMAMSYRQAWGLVKSMNERAAKPLVERQAGGAAGGGAKLTKSGEKALALYQELDREAKDFLKKAERKLRGI